MYVAREVATCCWLHIRLEDGCARIRCRLPPHLLFPSHTSRWGHVICNGLAPNCIHIYDGGEISFGYCTRAKEHSDTRNTLLMDFKEERWKIFLRHVFGILFFILSNPFILWVFFESFTKSIIKLHSSIDFSRKDFADLEICRVDTVRCSFFSSKW